MAHARARAARPVRQRQDPSGASVVRTLGRDADRRTGDRRRRASERGAAIAIDDADLAAEELLLHLYNGVIEAGASVLLTMQSPPASLPIALADLASRLRALPVAGIAPPDDELLGAVLFKHFADRQILVRPGVIAYLVARIERSFAAAASVAARLDAEALGAKRPITVRLARAVLAEFGDHSVPPSDLTAT